MATHEHPSDSNLTTAKNITNTVHQVFSCIRFGAGLGALTVFVKV